MTKVIIKEIDNSKNKIVTSGDMVICQDKTIWLLIRLENNEFIAYNLQTHKYMTIRDERGTYITLGSVNKTLASRYGTEDMLIKLIKSDEVIINLEINK
jgi:regulator of sigma D